ncbi:MAG: hypothetical protein M3Q80_01120 [bacterium]|nr:hypothetical protein [bacterium]
MSSEDDKNRIEDLKKSLYSRNAPDVRTRRKLRFSPTESQVKTDWGKSTDVAEPTVLNTNYQNNSMSYLAKILIGSLIFFVIAMGIGTFLFYKGANFISGDNIDIVIRGPVSIPGGAPVSFEINVINKNNVDLELADLSVEFPEGTTDPENPSIELKEFRQLIGDIEAGKSAQKTVRAIIFGQENLQKQINVEVNYKLKGSDSFFTKTTSYDVLINSSPVLLTTSTFNEISSGQEFDMKVSVKSNSSDTLKNVLLKATYPTGYSYISSDLKPLADNATWKLGDIPAGTEKVVIIHGKILGEDSETRVFRFATGAQSATDAKLIGTQYMSTEQSLTIQKPFVSLGIAIDNKTDPIHTGYFDKNQRVTIEWFNNLPSAVSNMVITAKLSGTVYDRNTVQPDEGYFNSATNEIVWNPQTNREFALVGAGESGTVSYSISPTTPVNTATPITNPTLIVTAGVSGSRTQGSTVPEKLSSLVTRTSRIATNVSLTGRVLRNSGPFTNTGPIPPKVDVASTYTIVWTINNGVNAVSNTQVTASLPPYVKWLGVLSPANENVTYDKNSGLITWDVGNVVANTLDSTRRREVNFQISVTPNINLVNQAPLIVTQAQLTAIDTFTGIQLEAQQEQLTTRFSTDSSYKEGQANVVQ